MSDAGDALHNPLDDLISFPESVLVQRQDILPSESSGWGVHLVLNLARTIVMAGLEQQLAMAGFAAESSRGQPGLLRFIREDAYVWGMVSTVAEGRTVALISYTSGKAEPEEPA